MKTYKFTPYFLGLVAAAGFSLASCDSEDPDYFDEAAAYRMDDAKKETKAALCASPNGWEMLYFPDNDWEPGYELLMKFNEDGSVKMASNNVWAQYAMTGTPGSVNLLPSSLFVANMYEDVSLYKMISDAGPVLTFDTYNQILHPFCDPYDVALTGADENGLGHKGDWEFIIMKMTPDTIYVRGKTTEINMQFRRMAEGTDWAEHLAKMRDNALNTFSSTFDHFVLTLGDKRFIMNHAYTGSYDLYAEGDDALTSTTTLRGMFTSNSLRLQNPFNGDTMGDGTNIVEGQSVQEFFFDENGVLRADNASIAPLYNPAQYVGMQGYKWQFSLKEGESGGAIAEAIAQMASDLKTKLKKTLSRLQIYYSDKEKSNILQFMYTGGSGNPAEGSAPAVYGAAPAAEGENVQFAYSTTEANKNGLNRLKDVPGFTTVINTLNACKWVAVPEGCSLYSPSKIRLTDVNNPANFVIVNWAKL